MERSTPRSGNVTGTRTSSMPAAETGPAQAPSNPRSSILASGFDQRAHRSVAAVSVPVGALVNISRRLAANWKQIALAGLAGLLLGQMYLWVATPMYSSTASLLIDPRAPKIGEAVRDGIDPNMMSLESQVAVMTSDSVLKKVVENLKLADDPEFATEKPPLIQAIVSALTPGRTTGTAAERALAALEKILHVARTHKTYVVDVTATTMSPQKSAAIVTAVIDAYFADQTNSSGAKHTQQLIDDRLSELREQVRQAELKAAQHKNADQRLPPESGVINEQQLARLTAELAVAKAAATEVKAQRDQIDSAIKGGSQADVLGEVGQTSLIARLREQYAQIVLQEASLSSQLRPSHPSVIDVRAQIAALKAEIAAELKRAATAAESAHRVASAREKELEKQLDTAKQESALQNAAQSRQRALEQDVLTNRELLKTFLAGSEKMPEQQNRTTPETRVINAAVVSTAPSRPVPLFVLAVSLISGLMAGVMSALRNSRADHIIAATADLAAQTGVPSVSIIPQLKRSFSAIRSDRPYGVQYNALIAALETHAPQGTTVYRQAILRLLSKIKSHGRAGRPNTVMLTSARSNSGNSASILATAYSAAISGERVLLVDATSTNPELSGIFAGNLSKSTTVILDSKEHLNKIVTRDDRSGLSFLPIALADLRTLRVQQRRRLAAGLNLLSQDYDWIFIDAGSLLDDEAATTLLPSADIVFLLARAGVTTRKDIDDMMQILEPARERIAGSILTFAEG